MSVRIGVIAAVVVACLGMSACAGPRDAGSDSESATEASEAESASSSATAQEEATGERVHLSVASFVLPESLEFTEKTVADDEGLDYRKWYTTYPGTDIPSCAISVSVESDVGDNAVVLLLEESKQMRKKNLQTAKMDPDVPEDVVGTVVTYAGPFEAEDGSEKGFSSIGRQWQTPGNSLIGMSVTANDDGPKQCDPEAIAASLEWSGQERPVGGAE